MGENRVQKHILCIKPSYERPCLYILNMCEARAGVCVCVTNYAVGPILLVTKYIPLSDRHLVEDLPLLAGYNLAFRNPKDWDLSGKSINLM